MCSCNSLGLLGSFMSCSCGRAHHPTKHSVFNARTRSEDAPRVDFWQTKRAGELGCVCDVLQSPAECLGTGVALRACLRFVISRSSLESDRRLHPTQLCHYSPRTSSSSSSPIWSRARLTGVP